jgi:hypothetical protein
MLIKLEEETVTACLICRKIWKRKDADKWIFCKGFGVLCKCHNGVMEWYDEKLEEACKELKGIME